MSEVNRHAVGLPAGCQHGEGRKRMHLSASYPRANSQYALYSFICFSFFSPTGQSLSPLRLLGRGDRCRIAQETRRVVRRSDIPATCRCNQHTQSYTVRPKHCYCSWPSPCVVAETVGKESLQALQVAKLFRHLTRQRVHPVVAVLQGECILQAPAHGLLVGVWQPPRRA